MTKSDGRKSFSIDALLARTTASSTSQKGPSSSYGNGVPPPIYHNDSRCDHYTNNNIINNNNNNNDSTEKRELSQVENSNSQSNAHGDRLREVPKIEDDRKTRNVVSSSSLSPSRPCSETTERLENIDNPDFAVSGDLRRDQTSIPRKNMISPHDSKELRVSDSHFLRKSPEEEIRYKQDGSSPFNYHHLEQQNLSLLLSAQQQQIKRPSVVSSSPTSPSASSPSSSSPLASAERATRHQETPMVNPLAPSPLQYPGDLRLSQFPMHPFHSHLRTPALAGQLGTPRSSLPGRPMNTNSYNNSNSKISSSLDSSLAFRHRQHPHHDLSKYKSKLDASPDRPISSGKIRSPAPSPSRSAPSACSSPRSHTPESPTHSPKGVVGGADRGLPSTIRRRSPSPQRLSPPGTIPAGAGGFLPRPGLLGLSHHGLAPPAGHLGYQVRKIKKKIAKTLSSLDAH